MISGIVGGVGSNDANSDICTYDAFLAAKHFYR